MILRLTGNVTIQALMLILSEVASFCGEDSKVTLADTPIALDIAHFIEDPDEQELVIEDMLNTLAKYPVQATSGKRGDSTEDHN